MTQKSVFIASQETNYEAKHGCEPFYGRISHLQGIRGDEGRIRDAPREGRPPATTPDEDLAIVAAVSCELTLSLAEVRNELGPRVSLSTNRRRLNEAGLRSRVACQRPWLSQRHKQQRLEFTREHISWGPEEWRLVIFSDESTFVSRWDQQQRVWRLIDALQELGVQLVSWPPKGADFNLIEQIWGMMKRNLAMRTFQHQSKAELWAAMSEEWEKLSGLADLVPRLYASILKRIADAVHANGAFTRN
ncbi:uncharacterized protein LOC144127466 [Amblyomma americanum]